MDPATIAMLAAAALTLLAGNAALYGDTLSVQIGVSPRLAAVGFTGMTAEQVFITEAARVVQGESVIPSPGLRISTRPTVVSALAQPLQLGALVGAIQDQFGMNRLAVNGSLLSEDGVKLRMVIEVSQPDRLPLHIDLKSEDGDAVALVRHGADVALEQISPYRVVLASFTTGMRSRNETQLQHARSAATREVARPFDPLRVSERAMLRNILAMFALHEGDLEEADRELRLAESMPNVLPMARGVIALNRAFVAVALKRPARAERMMKAARSLGGRIEIAGFEMQMDIIEALVSWSAGDMVRAEAQLRTLVDAHPEDEDGHAYLAQLLATGGNEDAAAKEATAARKARRFNQPVSIVASSTVWVDPVVGGAKARK